MHRQAAECHPLGQLDQVVVEGERLPAGNAHFTEDAEIGGLVDEIERHLLVHGLERCGPHE